MAGSEDAFGAGGEIEGDRGHDPVLLERVVEVLAPKPESRIFDGTVGLGGHAAAILARLGDRGWLVGVDRDSEALERARARLDPIGRTFHLYRGLYTEIREALRSAGREAERGLDGILLDLGVSSLQLDAARRGFSFMRDGPLDMRMSSGVGMSAEEWLARASVSELTEVLRRHGEEPAAARIARAIDRQRRREAPLRTTAELAAVVESVCPRRGRRIHPATRTFQAIRIAVNRELEHLESFLAQVDRYLAPGGRLAVLSYHSLEDRLVKDWIRRRAREGLFEEVRPEWFAPDSKENERNPRARSARLRWTRRRG